MGKFLTDREQQILYLRGKWQGIKIGYKQALKDLKSFQCKQMKIIDKKTIKYYQ